MDIIIKDNNASQSIIDQNKVRWKHYAKKTLRFIILTYAFGLILFIFGMARFSEYGWRVVDDEYTHYSNWHLSESFGFVIIVIATLSLSNYFKYKKQFFKTVNRVSDRYAKTTNEILIHITDDNLIYRSYELTLDMKWWLFSSYTLHDNYLFLNSDETPKSSVTIDKRLINPDEFNNILEFIKKKRLVPKQ